MKDIKFIAEIGSNHNQSMERIEELIKEVSELGFWGIKFQLFDESMYKDQHKKELITSQKLPLSFLNPIKYICKKHKLKFGITPFYDEAIEIAAKHADYIKVSSFDTGRIEFIKKCVMTNKQFMISFGTSTDKEVVIIHQYIHDLSIRKDSVFMHCVSGYPVEEFEAATGRIKAMKKMLYNDHVGYSDHTVSIEVILSAIIEGAEYIEMHYQTANSKSIMK